MNTIIFDLGGVLLDWNPLYVYDETYFKTPEQRDYFFSRICTSEWNEEQDAGRSIVTGTNLLVEQFLAFAENQARQKKVMYMSDWIKKLNGILTINEKEILEQAGKISHELALQQAELEYEKFRAERLKTEDLKALEELNKEIKQLGKSKFPKKKQD